VTVGGTNAGAGNVIAGNKADGVFIFGDGSIIQGNFVGLGADGLTALGNGGNGIEVIGLVQIGGSLAAARNLISANTGAGIILGGGGTRPATIQGNDIGTDSTGTQARGNKAGGIAIGTAGATIGGPNSGDANVIAANGALGNKSSTTGGITLGNFGNGISADNNLIQGNLIGTAKDGVSPLGNVGGGIIVGLDASNNQVEGNTIAYNNTSASPVGGGIAFEYSVDSSTGDRIDGNSIFANTGLGIDLGDDGVTPNTPGGPHDGPNDFQNFPVITSVSSDGGLTSILGTLNAAPGTSFTIQFFSNSTADPSAYGQGKTPFGEISDVTTNSKGNVSFSASINLPLGLGQFITATATDPAGNTSEFSQDFQSPAASPLIVTTTADSGLGSLRAAITYANANPGSDTITFAIPGTGVQTIALTSPLPTINVPVTIDGYSQPGTHTNALAQGDSATILVAINGALTGGGGFAPSTGDGLVLSGGNSTVRGLAIGGFTSGAAIHLLALGGDTIAGDFLGTDPTGTLAKPDQVGVQVETIRNTIGGETPADRDVVSANTLAEIDLFGSGAIDNKVDGDFVGTSAAGAASLSNPGGGDGVAIAFGASGNTVGGLAASDRNVLSGNGASGVRIDGGTFSDLNTGNNIIQGNLIGTDASGTAGLANGADGVVFSNAYGNTIGGTTLAAANTIAFNVLNGVDILTGPGNPILGNLIFGNHRLGIDLGGDGVTPNTPGGPRAGPNDLQNFPVLSTVGVTASSTVFTGMLTAAPGAVFTVQFFSNDTADPSGYGQAKTFLGELTNVATNSDGLASFTASLPTVLPPGQFVTATATDANGDTSEFSHDIQYVAASTADLKLSISQSTPNPGLTTEDYSYTVTVTNAGPQNATNVVVNDTFATGARLDTVTTAGVVKNLSHTQTDVTFATLAPGASVTATFEVRASSAGKYTDTAAVTADQADPDKTNNSATVTETVEPPTADLSVVGTVMPDIAIVGKLLTYTFTVTNKGPNPATAVKLSDMLPAGVTFVSIKSSLGTGNFVGGIVTTTVGTLGTGATATVTIVAIPSTAGTITDTAKVGADQVDPHPADNHVTVLVATTLDAPINVFSSLMTTKGSDHVLVTWGYAVSAQIGIRFNVYRVNPSGTEIKISGPTGTSEHDFIDTSVEANKTYVYRVTAFVGNGEGALSDPTTIVVTLNSSSGFGADISRTRGRQPSGSAAPFDRDTTKSAGPSPIHRQRIRFHVKHSSQIRQRPSSYHKATRFS
jgi:uncharacterized repeat protein (TIGR01451 family)